MKKFLFTIAAAFALTACTHTSNNACGRCTCICEADSLVNDTIEVVEVADSVVNE